jgi:hypothetical protein
MPHGLSASNEAWRGPPQSVLRALVYILMAGTPFSYNRYKQRPF